MGVLLMENRLLTWGDSKLDWVPYIVTIAKSVSKKTETLIRSEKIIFREVMFYLLYDHACDDIVVSGLVHLIASWICWYVFVYILDIITFGFIIWITSWCGWKWKSVLMHCSNLFFFVIFFIEVWFIIISLIFW